MPLVILTQELEDAERQARLLSAHGIEALIYPCIETRMVEFGQELPLSRPLAEFEVLAFTSRRGVTGLRPYRGRLNPDCVIACVGDTTARAAREQLGHAATVVPREATSGALAQLLLSTLPPSSLLHVRGSLGGSAFRDTLREAGWDIEELVAYENVEPVLEPLQVEGPAVAVFASESAAQRLSSANPGLIKSLGCVAIGPVTASALRGLGAKAVQVAPQPEALLHTVLAAMNGVSTHEQA